MKKRVQNLRGAKAAEKDLAYMAGFFDGEGTITMSKIKNKGRLYYGLRLAVGQLDPRPLELFVRSFGGEIVFYKGKFRDYAGRWSTWVVKSCDIEFFLTSLLPYLILKKEEALVALDYVRHPWSKNSTLSDLDRAAGERCHSRLKDLKRLRGGSISCPSS